MVCFYLEFLVAGSKRLRLLTLIDSKKGCIIDSNSDGLLIVSLDRSSLIRDIN